MKRPVLTALLALLTGSAAATAAGPVDVSPLVNDRTIAVARISVPQLKVRAAADWAAGLASQAGLDAEHLTQFQQGGAAVAMLVQPGLDSLSRAGVDEVAIVVNLNTPAVDKPILLIALAKPANPDAVLNALAPTTMRHGEKGNLMVFSPNLPPGVLGAMQAGERPDLLAACGPLEGHAFVAGIAFTDAAKKELAATDRTEQDRDMTARLLTNVKQYTVRADAAGQAHLQAAAETTSPEAADAIMELIHRGGTNAELRAWADLAKALPFKKDNSVVSLDMKQADFEAAAKAATPLVTVGRESAKRVQSMSNLRTLMQLAMISANENKGATPQTLNDLEQYLGNPPRGKLSDLLTNPQKPELADQGYIYVRPAEKMAKIKMPSQAVAIYEAGDFGDGINVAFWDGHIEQIRNAEQFKKLLDATQATATTQPGH